MAVRQPGRDTRGTLAYLLNDLSVMLIIVSGGKVGSEEAPAISTEINKITIAPKRDNIQYNVEMDSGLTTTVLEFSFDKNNLMFTYSLVSRFILSFPFLAIQESRSTASNEKLSRAGNKATPTQF